MAELTEERKRELHQRIADRKLKLQKGRQQVAGGRFPVPEQNNTTIEIYALRWPLCEARLKEKGEIR